MSTAIKKKSSSNKSLNLTSHDITVLSAIAQQPHLPSSYLLAYAKKLKISPDAYDVLEVIVREPKSLQANDGAKKSMKGSRKEVADVFQRWSYAFKRPA
jgi:hypothetical protein